MPIRKILAPLVGRYDAEELAEVSETTLRAGFALGRDLGAHVEVCCIAAAWHDPEDKLSAGIPGSAIEQLMAAIDKRNEESFWFARGLFDKVAEEFAPQRDTEPGPDGGFSASFFEVTGEFGHVAAERGKLADLMVIAAKPESGHGRYDRLLYDLLTESGRPLLIVPAGEPALSLEKVAIAWNGSAEAARAVALALDLIRAAAEAVIITVHEDGIPAAGPQDLADYLAWHGVKTRVVEGEGSGRDVGDLLLQEAQQAGAGLLVMGAYTRGTLRRIVFGGATKKMLASPSLPLLMVD